MKTSKDFSAFRCPKCQRNLPASYFRHRDRINSKGYRTQYYETWACKDCKVRYNEQFRTTKPRRVLECPQCGRVFKTRHSQKKYCSKGCQIKANYSYDYTPEPKQCRLLPLPCPRCGSEGPKHAKETRQGSGLCKECKNAEAKEYRARKAKENPEWHKRQLEKLYTYKEEYPYTGGKRSYSRENGDTLTAAEWDVILDAFNHQCAYCDTHEEELEWLEREHVVPYKDGGRLCVGNVVPACPECNGVNGKYDQDLREWIQDEQRYEFVHMMLGETEYLCAL